MTAPISFSQKITEHIFTQDEIIKRLRADNEYLAAENRGLTQLVEKLEGEITSLEKTLREVFEE
jgi:hypothetical protein